MTSAEQQARDLLELMGIKQAQGFTAGDVVELANLIAERNAAKASLLEHQQAMNIQGAVMRARRLFTNELMSACAELLEVVGREMLDDDTVGDDWPALKNAIKRINSVMGRGDRSDTIITLSTKEPPPCNY